MAFGDKVDFAILVSIISNFPRNSMNYKDDMDGPKFEAFLHEVCRRAIARYGTKVALVMDNASYHTVLVCTDTHLL